MIIESTVWERIKVLGVVFTAVIVVASLIALIIAIRDVHPTRIAVCSAIFLYSVAAIRYGVKRLLFDKDTGIISIRNHFPFLLFPLKKDVSLSDLRSVTIYHKKGEGFGEGRREPSWRVTLDIKTGKKENVFIDGRQYEMEETIKMVNIVSRPNEREMETLAKQISEFVGKPTFRRDAT